MNYIESAETGIRENVIEEIRTLAQKHGISRVILFGSRSRGDYGRKSDIDLAVSGADVMRFALDIDEETSTLLMFDVVDLDGCVSDALLSEIRRDGLVIYEKI